MDVLLGLSQRTETKVGHDIDFYDKSLNDSQRQAVRFTLSSNEFACIHGPPGRFPASAQWCFLNKCRDGKDPYTHRDYQATPVPARKGHRGEYEARAEGARLWRIQPRRG